jgi:hypothetical protein
MDILQLILFISCLLTINAQWYIKKTYQTKNMNYPNPGKRSIPEESTSFDETDCLKPYSHLHSYQQKFAWIFGCTYRRSSLETDENSLSSNLNNFYVESPTIPTLILHGKRSPHVVPPYLTEYNNSFEKLLRKLLPHGIRTNRNN